MSSLVLAQPLKYEGRAAVLEEEQILSSTVNGPSPTELIRPWLHAVEPSLKDIKRICWLN